MLGIIMTFITWFGSIGVYYVFIDPSIYYPTLFFLQYASELLVLLVLETALGDSHHSPLGELSAYLPRLIHKLTSFSHFKSLFIDIIKLIIKL